MSLIDTVITYPSSLALLWIRPQVIWPLHLFTLYTITPSIITLFINPCDSTFSNFILIISPGDIHLKFNFMGLKHFQVQFMQVLYIAVFHCPQFLTSKWAIASLYLMCLFSLWLHDSPQLTYVNPSKAQMQHNPTLTPLFYNHSATSHLVTIWIGIF